MLWSLDPELENTTVHTSGSLLILRPESILLCIMDCRKLKGMKFIKPIYSCIGESQADWLIGGKESQCQVTESTYWDIVKVKLKYFTFTIIWRDTFRKVPLDLASATSQSEPTLLLMRAISMSLSFTTAEGMCLHMYIYSGKLKIWLRKGDIRTNQFNLPQLWHFKISWIKFILSFVIFVRYGPTWPDIAALPATSQSEST